MLINLGELMPEPLVPPPRGAIHVLLVDDEPALLRGTARHLRASGCTVTECGDGASAARIIQPQAFQVVVSDIDMPGLSGIDLLRLLRERGIEVPVILITGAPTLDTAVQAVEHGAFKYLMKPVKPEELRDTVERAARWRGSTAPGSRGPRPSTESSGVLSKTEVAAYATHASIADGIVLAGGYRLSRLLGEGGMSQVWEGTQIGTGREVAVKVLQSALNMRFDMRRRLLREARAAGAVAHPNVVNVFDVFELEDGTPVLVMELLRGHTLTRRLADSGRLSVCDAADLLLPVVSAVGSAHARGVIHRDLKPENIFLSEEGGRTTVKVLDFGIAKLASSDEQGTGALTATGAIVGTPGYMSPEQALGERDVDHRADIWSIGAILYEALAGVRPVQADTLGHMLKQLFTEGIVPLSQLVPELSQEVACLVSRMLTRERDERPADLREVHSELARHARVSALTFGPPRAAPASGVMPSLEPALGYARTEQSDAPPVLNRSR